MTKRAPARPTPAVPERIRPHGIVHEIRTSFLDYSMSVIVSRALPDARDGLKPVQRRILVVCADEGLTPGRPYKKAATVVGTALGRYHPHGDSSVYDALVRLAQPFAMAEPLIDGQGNFGSIDGDPAAAYRYTEARLTPASAELLADLEKQTVDFRPNFDGRFEEPVVLPARLPNLLLNGSEGIAVGMATRIPPHNLRELGAAIELLCEHPDADDAAVIAKVKGPDFPTGGILLQGPEIKQLYRTGRGRLTLRAKAHVETTRAGRPAIVVTEIPYGVSKAKLLEDIAELVRESSKASSSRDKKDAKPSRTRKPKAPAYVWHEWISDLRDESDREGLRMLIELKKDADASTVLRALYEKTGLSLTYGAQMIALVNNAPVVLTLKRALEVFVAHRLTVVVRRAQFEMDKALERAHIVEGLTIALAHIDEIVALIRKAADTAVASAQLQKRYKLSERQADAILQMRLAKLTSLEVKALAAELATLKTTIASLRALLASPAAQRERVRDETRDAVARFGRPRRTQFLSAKTAEEVTPETIEYAQQLVLTWNGRLQVAPDGPAPKGRGNDPVRGRQRLLTAESATLLTTAGRALAVTTHDVPPGDAVPLAAIVQGTPASERICWMGGPSRLVDDRFALFVLANGLVKRTALSEYATIRAGGIAAIALQPDDRIVAVLDVAESDEVLLASRDGKAIRFPVSDVPVQGRAARGVQGLKLAADDVVVGATTLAGASPVVIVTRDGGLKRVAADEFPAQHRAGQGVIAAKLSPATGPIVAVVTLASDDDLLVQSEKNLVVRLQAGLVPKASRAAAPAAVSSITWPVARAGGIPSLASLKR